MVVAVISTSLSILSIHSILENLHSIRSRFDQFYHHGINIVFYAT
jgi:hypothetical protein